MASIYKIASGVWYAPKWRHPETGEIIPAHSLGTHDRETAETAWILERARLLRPAAAQAGVFDRAPTTPGNRPQGAQLALGPSEPFPMALAAYAASKRKWKPATRARAAYAIEAMLDRRFRVGEGPETSLREKRVAELAGTTGEETIAAWADAEIARAGGRTHTVVKLIANFIKPALEFADRKGWMAGERFPRFPEIASDYQAEGAREIYLERAQFVALAGELAEHDAIVPRKRGSRAPLGVYPRLAAMIGVSTGLHESNINDFSEAHFDHESDRWLRVNSKGADHYPPEWFPCRIFLAQALRSARVRWPAHYCGRWDNWDRRPARPVCRTCGAEARLFVSDGGLPPPEWLTHRMKWAARRARLPFAPATIDLRRTFATWARDEGWEFSEVAKWLGNSSGMVEKVYAQLANARFERLVEKGALLERETLSMLALPGPRRGPRVSRTQYLPPKRGAI